MWPVLMVYADTYSLPSLAGRANSVRSVSFGGGLPVREGIRFLRSTSSSGVSRWVLCDTNRSTCLIVHGLMLSKQRVAAMSARFVTSEDQLATLDSAKVSMYPVGSRWVILGRVFHLE